MRSGPLARTGVSTAPLLAALIFGFAAGEVRAQLPHPPDLGELLFGKRPEADRGPMPRLGRFRSDSGDTFVLELNVRGPAFLKYDDSGEVWALTPSPGPRGDTIYKNDIGEPMLRTTRLGGMTVFTQDRPSGMAAAFDGAATDLHNLLVAGPVAMLHVLAQASLRTSRIAGHTVAFEANELEPGAEPVFADAAGLTVQAFARAEHKGPLGHNTVARYNKVALLNGRPPGVKTVGDEVRITVTPDLGFAGRPSSQRICQVLMRR